MNSELALQKLTEAREAVDGETAEMIDSLARVIMLQKDLRSPMIGAKVTLYTRPNTETYMAPRSEVPEFVKDTWREKFSSDDKDYWGNWEFDWWDKKYEGEEEEVVKFEVEVNDDDPELLSHQALVIDGNIAESAPDEKLWDPDKQEYNTPEDYPSGTINCAVAYPYHGGDVHNHQVDPDKIKNFEEDYPTNVVSFTSVTPAKGDPEPHTYTPGWD